MEAPKILVIDDTFENIDILRKTLEPEGFEVAISSSGSTGVKIAENIKPDLILLDIMMPEQNGFQTCEQLKSSEVTKNIPVIFISARDSTEDIVKGFRAGGVDYITKPFKQAEVIARIHTHLEMQSLVRHRDKLILELEEKNLKLEDMNQQKNRFLGIAAHDLRNPISSIRGYSELLLEEDDLLPEEQTECLNVIHRVSKNMASLVNDLLDISIIESGHLELKLQRGPLQKTIEQRINVNAILAEKKGSVLIANLQDIPDCEFDVHRFGQVMDNLINNAIKYSPRGSKIKIGLKHEKGKAVVTVKDQGPGISSMDHPKLFKEFQKLSAIPTAGEKGTGLGLAIVKKIIDEHGGSIHVESEAEKGSLFVIQIPLIKDSSP